MFSNPCFRSILPRTVRFSKSLLDTSMLRQNLLPMSLREFLCTIHVHHCRSSLVFKKTLSKHYPPDSLISWVLCERIPDCSQRLLHKYYSIVTALMRRTHLHLILCSANYICIVIALFCICNVENEWRFVLLTEWLPLITLPLFQYLSPSKVPIHEP